MARKVRHFRLEDETYRRLTDLVTKKYGNKHSFLSFEVESAIKSWIAQHAQSEHVFKRNPNLKVNMVFRSVKEYLKSEYGIEMQSHSFHIKKAIESVRGNDKRTVKKWFKEFIKSGLIKPHSKKGEIFEIVG